MSMSTNKKIIYSNSTMSNRNERMRRLLCRITNSELQNLIRVREEARRSIPGPRMKKQQPVAAARTRISEKRRSLNGYTKSYEIGIKSNFGALAQPQNTRLTTSRFFNTILTGTKGFKFVETLVVTFSKGKDDKILYSNPIHYNSRAQIVINPNDFAPRLNYDSSSY